MNAKSIVCALFGHRLADPYENGAAPNACRCGRTILSANDFDSRIRHVVSCFLRGHDYVAMRTRFGYQEFACETCGHPLPVPTSANDTNFIHKKPRYLCNLFGHKPIVKVTVRNGFTEYVCHCGHAFLKIQRGLDKVKHPLVCLFAGHFVREISRWGEQAEHLCRNCGHNFYFRTNRSS